jgi:hypothetical protein
MPNLTVLSLQAYKPSTTRREIRDHGAPGLHLVIQPKPTGTRSWALRFRDARGKSAKLALGPLDLTDDKQLSGKMLPPQPGEPLTLGRARQLAATLQAERMRGVDIVAVYAAKNRRTAAVDVDASSFKTLAIEFFRVYRTRHKERPRRWRSDARLLGLAWERDDDPVKVEPAVLPGSLCYRWGKRPVAEIGRRELENVIDEATKKSIPGLVARNTEASENRGRKLHAILSLYFSWLAKRHIDANPTTAIEAPSAPAARKRVLTASELRWCWLAAAPTKTPFPHGPIVQLLLLSGQRKEEISAMARSELNQDFSQWTLPSKRSKNRRAHELRLPVTAREIIGKVPKIEGQDLIFSIGGKSPPSNWNKAKRALDAKMAEIAKEELGKAVTIPHWTLHDLRRTLISGLQHLGIRKDVRDALANHVSTDSSAPYERDEMIEDIRAALSTWSRYVAMVVDPKLHAAHEAFLLSGDEDQRDIDFRHFRKCVQDAERYKTYIDALNGKKSPMSDLSSERKRRGKR